MKWVWIVLATLAVAGIALSIWIRARPVPEDRIVYPDRVWEAGDHEIPGGFVAARQVGDPDAAFRRLAAIIAETPRTELRAGGPDEGRLIAVTRSAVMGFPDVTQVWTAGDLLLIRGRLVIGQSDLGVNRRRILGWLDAAGLSRDGD